MCLYIGLDDYILLVCLFIDRDDYTILEPHVRLMAGGNATVRVSLILEPESGDQERESFKLEMREETGLLPSNVFFRESQITILDRS